MKKELFSVAIVLGLLAPQATLWAADADDTKPPVASDVSKDKTDISKDTKDIKADQGTLKTLNDQVSAQRTQMQTDQKAYADAVKQFGANSTQAQAAKTTMKADHQKFVSLVHQRNDARRDMRKDIVDRRRDINDLHKDRRDVREDRRDMHEMHGKS